MADRQPRFPASPEFLELLARYFNGPLKPNDLALLETHLRSDPVARDLFIRTAELDAMLMERSLDGKQALPIGTEVTMAPHKANISTNISSGSSLHDATVIAAIHEEDIADDADIAIDPPPAIPPIQQPSSNWKSLTARISAAAIVLLCVGLLGYLLHRPKPQAPALPQIAGSEQPAVVPTPEPAPETTPAVATGPVAVPPPAAVLVAAIDAKFEVVQEGQALPVVGEALSAAPQFLECGWAKIEFPNGVSAIVEGPVRFKVESATVLRLDQGRVAAHVAQQGRGFTVVSGACRVVDLGTDFGVSVSDQGANEIQVFEGQVALSHNPSEKLAPENTTKTPAASIVVAGEARWVEKAGSPAVPIPARPENFVRVNEFNRWEKSTDPSSPDRLTTYYEKLARSPGLSLLYVPNTANQSVLKNQALSTSGNFDMPIAGDTAPTVVDGRASGIGALNFDSTKSQRLVIAEYPLTQTGNVSGIIWVKLHAYVPYASILKSWGDSKSGVFHLGLNNRTRQLEIQIDGTRDGGPVAHEEVEFPLDEWQAVAFTSDGIRLRLYRDGKEVASAPSRPVSLAGAMHSLAIGCKTGDDGMNPSPTNAAGFWDGQIGEIALFDRALSAQEVFQMSQVGRP